MPNYALIITTIISMITFAVSNFLVIRFADQFLQFPRFKLLGRIVTVIINTGIITLAMLLPISTTFFTYIIIYILFFFEFFILFKESLLKIFCMTSAYVLHIMAIRAICVAMYSMQSGMSFYTVVNNLVHLTITTSITFLVLSIILLLVTNKSIMNQITHLNRYQEQLRFLTHFMLPINVFFIVTSNVYSVETNYKLLNQSEIFSSVLIIAVTYLVFFFSAKSSFLLGYKDKISELQSVITKEKLFKNTITGEAIATYEFNLSNNRFASEFAKTFRMDGITLSDYNSSMAMIAKRYVHSDDYETLIKTMSTSNLLSLYESGKTEVSFEYRRHRDEFVDSTDYIWVRCTTYLINDRESDDIKGLSYVKNIDEEKQVQIELQFKAERDSLTGLYNKGMTVKLIGEKFNSLKKDEQCAVLIVDVDNFKLVNDNLGHIFGDAVLCELSKKLVQIFTKNEIVGRIGGDEFLVFMPHTNNVEQITTAASEIVKHFLKQFNTKIAGEEFGISASVGIARYPMDGSSYEDLFMAADVALYNSKISGKNTYTFYNGEKFSAYHSNRTEIDTGLIPQKSFQNNRAEYIFKILYESENPYSAIQTVLELLTNHLDCSRGYIFEITDDGRKTNNTFEWCADGIAPQMDMLKNIPVSSIDSAVKAFADTGVFIVSDISKLPKIEREILEPQGIKSMLQFGYHDGGVLRGFVGFDDCFSTHTPSNIEIDEIAVVCNVLLTFLFKQRAIEKANKNLQLLQNVMNNINSFVYVINPDTFELIFINRNVNGVATGAKVGDLCYKMFRGFDCQCDDCPIRDIDREIGAYYVKEMHNKMLGIWLQVTTSNIDWFDGTRVSLISSVDISKYIAQKDDTTE